MRIAIPHDLPREEVRTRLKARSGEIADHVPGGMADVTTRWVNEDQMSMTISAMGQDIAGNIDIEDGQLVFAIELPAGLGFIRSFIENGIREKGQKLLA